MFSLEVGKHFGTEYVPVAEDILRTTVIQLFVQLMLSLVDNESGIFSSAFWLILVYIILGTHVYHLVFKHVVLVR